MSDELLRFYNSELQNLRKQGDRFAQANPQIAAHLRIGSEDDIDPYTRRLVEAFAYLNARTRQKLEDGFPEIAGSYLDLLYPHLQRPFPSAMIAQFRLNSGQAELFEGYQIPKGTSTQTPRGEGVACRFRTTQETTCWPFTVASTRLEGLPFRAPKVSLSTVAQGLLSVRLETQAEHVHFSNFTTQSLRFFIRLPQPFSYQMYEMLFDDVLAVALATGPDDPAPIFLSPQDIQRVGFSEAEGLVDYPAQSFLGYRLLSEFFSFPEKFLFFDVTFPKRQLPSSNRLQLYFYIRNRWEELEPMISNDSLQLGCCPVVNLFSKPVNPINLTHHQADYPLVPDTWNREAYEIYSIDKVTGIGGNREEIEYAPFYSMQHVGATNRYFWHASRYESDGRDELSRGTEMRLSLVDLQFNPVEVEGWRSVVYVDSTCTNRNLPQRLPVVPGKTPLELDASGSIDSCICLTKPSASHRPPMGQHRRWRLISQLTLNHMSFTDPATSAPALRELLGLYAFLGTESTQSLIEGIYRVEALPTVGRLPGDFSGALCRGTEVRITFEESKYTAGNVFLFASVLEQFFSLLSNINSFTRTVAFSTKRTGEFHQWPARAGQQPVL